MRFSGDHSEPIVLENELATEDEAAAKRRNSHGNRIARNRITRRAAIRTHANASSAAGRARRLHSLCRVPARHQQLNLEPIAPEPLDETPLAQADADAVEAAPSEAEPEALEAAPQQIEDAEAAAPDAAGTDEADLVELEPEPLATDAETPPVEAAEEELVEVEPEPEAATPEPAAPAAAEHERLFDLEPIEAPTPTLEEEEVSLEPVDHLASTPGAEEETEIVESLRSDAASYRHRRSKRRNCRRSRR